MHAAADRNQFAPPPPPGMLRAFVLAIFAHVLLLLALTWGVNWKRDAENVSAEAELWSATPQQAAPKLAEPPPAPPPPVPRPVPKPEPPPKPEALPTPRAPDIALEREKKKKQEEAKQRQEDAEQKKKLEAQKKALDQKKQDEAKKQDDQKKQERTRKAADDQKKADAARTEQAAKQLADSKRAEALRQDNLRRMQGLAGATGGPAAGGTAQRSAGMSDSYGGRIQARVRPNIVFSDDVSGNPTALVEVRMAPDGTITGKRIVKSSGVRAWDEAVLRALDKTEILPRDVDGRIHTPLEIQFSPK